MDTTHKLELFPDSTVVMLLFKDVKGAAELRQDVVEGSIHGALINPTMIMNPFQVLVAVNKAVHLHRNGKMKTRSLFSEIIFNLSPTNNISEAFKRFGMSDSDESVLVVLLGSAEEPPPLAAVIQKVQGQQIPLDLLPTLTDVAKIKKIYKVSLPEEQCGSLLDAVISRMATKDVM